MRVVGTNGAAAYRLTLPVDVYKIVTHADLADLRVFNSKGEPVPFAIERPVAGSVANTSKVLPVFPLRGDSSAALSALRVTIESGSSAVNVQAGGRVAPSDRIDAYLIDARPLESSISALELQWPQDAVDFAGRLKVEASDNLDAWTLVSPAAPIANLHATTEELVERRVELSSVRAKYLRLSWVGLAAPFAFTSVLAQPGKQSVEAPHSSLSVAGTPVESHPGEFEFDLGANVPVDRVNLQLPEANTVVAAELSSRAGVSEPWRLVRHLGLYRLNSGTDEVRNGPAAVITNSDRYWLLRADRKGGGLGHGAPQLVVEWIPHEVVFVARGSAPFYLAYGSVTAESAAVSLAAIPKALAIAPASLDAPERVGGEARLRGPAVAYAWKNRVLWVILIVAAALLAWMASRLFREVR
jgi:hypothetical protein